MINRSALLIVLLSLSGCSLYPYYPISPSIKLGPENVSRVEIMPTPSTGPALPKADNTGTLRCGDTRPGKNPDIPQTRECEVRKAIDYADAADREFQKAQGQHADMPGFAGLALLPAAASATALGIEGMGATAVTGLGVGAATLLGLGTYLHTPGRETVYNTGSLGIQCMLENMQPYTSVNSDDLFGLIQNTDPARLSPAGNQEASDLSKAKTQLELQTAHVEALGLQKDCNRLPKTMKFASLLLKAAKAADKSAEKAAQVGNEFATTALQAPITIVNTTNHINAALNGALKASEPDLAKLAGDVKSTIPDKAQGLAGLPAAKAAAADAQDQMQKATAQAAAVPSVPPLAASRAGIKAEGPDGGRELPPPPPPPAAPPDLTDLLALGLGHDEAINFKKLKDSISKVNDLVNKVMSIVGSNTGKVDNSKCPILAKKAGTVTAMKLNPDGDIVVSPGSKTKITISGATDPYTRPLFPQSVCSAVTATLKDSEIDVAATADTTPGFYPFFAGEGATGRVFNVMVPTKAPADDTDDVKKCPNKTDKGYVEPPKKDEDGQVKYSCPPALVLMAQPTATATAKPEAPPKKPQGAARPRGPSTNRPTPAPAPTPGN